MFQREGKEYDAYIFSLLFTLPVEEPSLDMEKGEEPRAHPDGHFSGYGIHGVELRNTAVLSATRSLLGMWP